MSAPKHLLLRRCLSYGIIRYKTSSGQKSMTKCMFHIPNSELTQCVSETIICAIRGSKSKIKHAIIV